MKEAFKLTTAIIVCSMGFGAGGSIASHLFQTEEKGLTQADYIPYLMSGEQAMNLLKDISTDEFLQSMATLGAFHAKHKEHATEQFVIEYKAGAGTPINVARRKVEMIYYRAQVARQLGLISEEALRLVMEPGSVAAFLKMVQPLSEVKPNPKPAIAEQRKFWEHYASV